MERISGAPIHTQLYQALRDWFTGGFRPGEQLPTEQEIINRFEVGRGTVRSALNELVREGLIERSAGRGSFLAPDFLIRLKRYSVGILLSDREFSGTDTWEYTWHNHVEMLNGVMKESLVKNISLEIIPEGAISSGLNNSFDAFISYRYIHPRRLALLEKPVIPFHYELDLAGGLAGVVRHMLDSGYTRPAYIGTAKAGRIDLINHFLHMNGSSSLKEEHIIECSGTVRDGYEACVQLLDRDVMPDCLICSTDMRALGVLKCLNEKGMTVPENLGVYGFDGIRETAQSSPPLTTWSFPWQELGIIAVREVRALLDGMEIPAYTPLKGSLIIRSSTAPPAGTTPAAVRDLPDPAADQTALTEYLKEIESAAGIEAALEKLYDWSFRSGYLTREKLESNEVRTLYDTDRDLDYIYQINYARSRYQAGRAPAAPGASCLICRENAGSEGRENLRVFDMKLDGGRDYFAQLTPFPLFPRHYVLIRKEHVPMDIGETALADGLAFLKAAPSFTVCSNSDLAWAGASILEHSHFQVFRDHDLPLMQARPLPGLRRWEGKVTAEMLDYPMPVLRLSGPERKDLVARGTRIIRNWKKQDPGKNTFNLLFYREKGLYRICLILRNSDHRNPEHLKRFKSEGIGVVEAAGEWIFPPTDEETMKELGLNARTIIQGFFAGLAPADPAAPGETERILNLLWEDSNEQ